MPDRTIMAAGTTIFGQGEPAVAAFLVLRGRVALFRNGEEGREPAGEVGPEALLGVEALLGTGPRAVSAVATEECEVLVVSAASLAERVGAADPLLRLCVGAVFGFVAGRVPEGTVPLPAWQRHFAAARDVIVFEHELRRGIERGELDVHYQPIVRLVDRRLAGFEALVRWRHPRRGLLQPNDFIPLAEASGVISDITLFCLRRVGAALPSFKAVAAARPDHLAPLFVSVNVSGLDLMHPAFAARAVSALEDEGAQPEDVRLEVTESILMSDLERCLVTLENCRAQGFRIAIDDFGTGYSSLNYLNTLPVSALKMDRSFTLSLLDQPVGRKIISAILQLGGELALSVIAEGVETELQAAMLQAMGCEYGQGFLFGRAIVEAEARELLGSWQAGAPAAVLDGRDLRRA